MSEPNQSKYWVMAALFAAVFAAVAYANTLDFELVFDDRPFLIDNPKLGETYSVLDFFEGNVWSYTPNSERFQPTRYRPLFFPTLLIFNDIWPGSSRALHALSISLHAMATLLLLLTIRRVVDNMTPFTGGLAACLFAVHPVNSEAIAWISAFVHPLVAVLLLTSFLLHDRARAGQGPLPMAGAWFFFGLALLANEMAVSFPIFIFLYEWIRGGTARLKPTAPYLLLLGGYMVLRSSQLGDISPLTFADPDLWLRFPAFFAEHLRYLLIPWPQPLYLAMPDSWGLSPASALSALLLLGLVAFLALRHRGNRQGLLIGATWSLVMLLPPLAANFNVQGVFALRVLYVPMIGVAIVFAWILKEFPVMRGKAATALIACALLAALATTFTANRNWRDDGMVYQRIIALNPDHYPGYLGFAEYLARDGKNAEAVEMYEKAISLANLPSKAEPMMRLGLLLGESGRSHYSLDIFQRLVKLEPDNASAWVGVGNNLWYLGRLEEAAVAYRRALQAEPSNRAGCQNLRMVLKQLGKSGEALPHGTCAELE